uniref:F-box domain-containing protein n=1 Tax=Caenorhabditis tropicalis TaxID=1561998 RepID=A0A1I7TEX1_9PELO
MADSEAVNGFLFCLFKQGKSEDEAFSFLKSVTTADYDIHQVADFYSRARINEYPFVGASEVAVPEQSKKPDEEQMEEKKEKPKTLLSLPDHIKRDVMKGLDLRGRFAFRQTCRYMRYFVDDTNFRMDKLCIHISGQSLRITNDTRELDLNYERIRNGVVLHKGSENAVIKRGRYDDLVVEELKQILITPRLIIGKLVIKEAEFDELETDHYRNMFHLIIHVLMNIENRIRVEKLFFNINSLGDAESLLPHFEPKYLKELMIGDEELDAIFRNLHSIHEFDQWKNAKSFRSRLRFGYHNFVRNFSHFDLAELRLEEDDFPTDILMELKDIYLTRKSFNQLKVDLWNFNNEHLDNYLMTIPGAARYRMNSWYFQYPESGSKLILEFTSDRFWFKGPEFQPMEEDDDFGEELHPIDLNEEEGHGNAVQVLPPNQNNRIDPDDLEGLAGVPPMERNRNRQFDGLVGQMLAGIRRRW